MSRYKLIVYCGIAVLASCAAKPVVPENTSFSCNNAAACDAKWSQAVAWADANAGFGITQQTDNLIQVAGTTDYNSYGNTGYFDLGLSNYSTRPGYIISKTANPDGSGAIVFHADCSAWSNCLPSPELERERFAAAIGN